jgi:hypothetical protein
MEQGIFERLAPPDAPAPWLAVISPGMEDYIIQVASSMHDLDLSELRNKWINWIKLGHDIVAMQDSPAVKAQYRGGLWACGETPALLTARRNWFQRYRTILEPHFRDPVPAIIHFYKRRLPDDLLCTMRSTESGPFPFLKGGDWPRCGHCQERMAFIGVLDFRNYNRVGKVQVPRGALVLHGCDQCTIPCTDDKSCSLTWITPEQKIELWGREKKSTIEVGIPWETIEFPTPSYPDFDPAQDADFAKEHAPWDNFACPLNKIGGHIRWIQDPYEPLDRDGNGMHYIGQFTETKDVELADSGIVYIFYSEQTQETKAVLQYY